MRLLLALSLGLVFTGCGPAGPTVYPVKGRVTFDGRPVTNGEILFESDDQTIAPDSALIVDGEYSANVKPGSVIVRIRAAKMMKLPGGRKGDEGQSEIMTHYIPDRYNDDSILKATITGPEELHYELTSK